MSKRDSNESTLSEVLKQIISENKLQNGIDKVEVEGAWHTVLGNGVKSYTKSAQLKGSVLYVELTSAVLREELHCEKERVIKLLNDHLGKEIISNLILR